MNLAAIFILLIGTGVCCHAQEGEMLAQGKVRDAMTGVGIKALINYRSIPTGTLYGKFNDSTFSFVIFGTARYEVTAEAEGYITRTVIVDPRRMDRYHRVSQDIRLLPEGQTIRLDRLIFAQGKSSIDPESFPELDQVVSMMKEYAGIIIQLEGHTDKLGAPDDNLKLSQDRVEAVKEYLIAKGISKNRIRTKAFGGARPLRVDETPEARAMNRRVEMRILSH